jgi:hypothetical protein
MRWICVLALGAAAWGASRGGPAEYVGGTAEELQTGLDGQLHTTHRTNLYFTARKRTLAIPYERINLIEYGQSVSRRYVTAVLISPLFLLSKSRKHFLTLGYQDENGEQQALVFRVDKNSIRPILASLEARTGVKVTYQDEEARKGGKG